MMEKRKSSGTNIIATDKGWRIDFYLQNKRYRKTFKYKNECTLFYQETINKLKEKEESRVLDNRRLSELIEKYTELELPRLSNKSRVLAVLNYYCEALDNPIARELSCEAVITLNSQRLREGIAMKTLNNQTGYLKRVFNFLIKQKIIEYENPLEPIEKYKYEQKEMKFLTKEEIVALRETIAKGNSKNLALVVDLCLATGARWGEVIGLSRYSVNIQSGKITFTHTKSKKPRTVPIAKPLMDRLIEHMAIYGDKPFKDPRIAFYNAIRESGIKLEKGQATHILRHTFASHFIMNGGDIATLQKILGHSEITMTLRYSHLAPEHLLSAVEKNPIAGMM